MGNYVPKIGADKDRGWLQGIDDNQAKIALIMIQAFKGWRGDIHKVRDAGLEVIELALESRRLVAQMKEIREKHDEKAKQTS